MDWDQGEVLVALFVDAHKHGDLVFFVVGVDVSALFFSFVAVLHADEHSCFEKTKFFEHRVVGLRDEACCLVLLFSVEIAAFGEEGLGYDEWRTLLHIHFILLEALRLLLGVNHRDFPDLSVLLADHELIEALTDDWLEGHLQDLACFPVEVTVVTDGVLLLLFHVIFHLLDGADLFGL